MLLKDSELYRVRGNMRVVAVFYESEDAFVVGWALRHTAVRLSRDARGLLDLTSEPARSDGRSWLDCHFLTNP